MTEPVTELDATGLVHDFARALSAVAPFGRNLGLGVGTRDGYDDWDRVASALFAWLVELPLSERIDSAASEVVEFVPYGLTVVALGGRWSFDAFDAATDSRIGRLVEIDFAPDDSMVVHLEPSHGARSLANAAANFTARPLAGLRFSATWNRA